MSTWIVNTAVLNGRDKPSKEGHIKHRRERGFKLGIVDTRKAEGLTWGRTGFDTFYALDFCREFKPGIAMGIMAESVKSPCPGYGVSTPYGKKKAGLWTTKGYHTGDDYASPGGTDVVAVLKGTAHRRWDDVLGNVVLLYASNNRTYWYCHLSHISVADGGTVRPGQVLGRVGQTGTGARGDHLHFESHDGHTSNWWADDDQPKW